MQLTPYQYAMLKKSQRYHLEGLSAGRVILRHWRFWLFFSLLAAIFHLYYHPIDPELAWAGIGFCLGGMLREAGHIRHIIRIWPVNNQIVSWEKVSELIQAHDRRQESFNLPGE
jgi:hypothetical protein